MIRIYNTLTQQKETFTPIEPGKVRMYVCGMTVYDYCHLGHARVLVAFDVITRYMRSRGYDVTYVRNITDIDDKILRRAEENGEPFTELTERMIAAMHEDEARLGVLSPSEEPRATDYIAEIIAMISTLIESDHAYAAANGDVYFSVESFENYGKLSKKKLEDLLAGARIDVQEAKRSPADFALWKAAGEGEVSWPSPWGNGRPGWHIECSAMSTHCLGNTFDIHGGGPDLLFPHHENEIAQSECATGHTFVNTWMHAGAIRVNKEKMSKSLGNFFTIREILETYPPEVVRFFLVSSHYRSQVDYSEDNLAEAGRSLARLYHALRGVEPMSSNDVPDTEQDRRFVELMNDDFNCPGAISVLHALANDINQHRREGREDDARKAATVMIRLGDVLGILQQNPDAFFQADSGGELTAEDIEAKIQARADARKSKDFAGADRIRDELAEQGIILDDSREGTSWRRS
ncbi:MULTISPECIES: cysteine--tRNA ligase [Marinobacter]|uniref:Cysteine--tRNA ligase n=1 Tax=Marinobacter xiaoshiensis TaxID=3073652 RepID=A0ABU2HF71_9GAMM|nr:MULTISPECIES: cysteine--tRNA ligase [unclassified Marinobacter]MBK1871951.1 cysteine--tRNA ligase [Marinobacter sp. 1-3A]MBK1885733.1 cysteine--tRNA ligase [Marinobacter sp. DY40_1A1]MDS1309723.1 cysteine--tRNA ligase [Marinobacter sp. F60267]